mmetsp:Transcript_92595/g.244422  ORF Transcript_92595/g.244422 Transcript_92595/m.244422 type:complete len:253 (+) Transcript_92595:1509-2267(+)
MSSRTSTMPPLFDSYAAAAGAPCWTSSSASSAWSWACTKAASFCLSAAEKEAPSMMTDKACKVPAMAEESNWAKEPPFAKTLVARSKASTASMSSFSPAWNSAFSFPRMPLAPLSSLSLFAMTPASSSTFAVATSMSEPNLVMEDSSRDLSALAVWISWSLFLVTSSHHSKYVWNSSSSAAPSSTIFSMRLVMSCSTLPNGFPVEAPVADATSRLKRSEAMRLRRHCIFAGRLRYPRRPLPYLSPLMKGGKL